MAATRPFFPLAAALAAGIWAGSVFYLAPLPAFAALAGLLVSSLALAAARGGRLPATPLLAAVFLLGMLNIGLVAGPGVPAGDISRLAGREVCIEGVVAEPPQRSEEKTEIVIEAARVLAGTDPIPASGKVLIRIMEAAGAGTPRYGDLVRVRARLKAPRSFRNPGGFDYERYLLLKGIRVRATVKSAACIAVVREEQGNILRLRLERFRSRLREIIAGSAPPAEAAVIQAMVLGEQSGIPRDVYDAFSRTGTSHIIAISGFNISIIALGIFFAIRSLMGTSERLLLRFDAARAAALLSIAPIIGFVFIAGLGISAVRAAVMSVAFLAGLLAGRERDLPNVLAFAAFAILAFSPASLFDVSFQLSFAAVAAILYLVPRVDSLLPKLDKGPAWKACRGLLLFCAVTLSATAGTLPLILYYFNLLSFVVLPANMVLLPVLGYIVLFLGMGATAASFVSAWTAGVFVKASAFFVSASIKMAVSMSGLPLAYSYVPTPSLPEIAAFYLLVYAASELFLVKRPEAAGAEGAPVHCGRGRGRMRLLLAAAVLFFAGDGAYHFLEQRCADRFTVTCLDVGQASSTYLEFPGGRKMLVDGGGFFDSSFDVGRFVVAPFLWHERVRRLDYLVLTHPHPDHLNGLIFILENFEVGEVWSNGQAGDTAEYAGFARLIREKGIPHRTVSSRSAPRDIGGVKIKFLNPGKVLSGDPNNDALAMRFQYGEAVLLMPSDIVAETEARLAARPGRSGLRSDVVIAAHHGAGSSNSPALVGAACPRAVIFSCGDNPHVPAPEVLQRYARARARIYRTDRDGAVAIRSEGGAKFIVSAARK